jgi:L-Ala-D/L-Glu epimerase
VTARMRAWEGPQGAKMALDGAVHDWVGRRYGLPVWRMLGTDGLLPATSFTVGLSTVDAAVRSVQRAHGFHVYKMKVGGTEDLGRLRAIRDVTSARLRVDGNEGWTFERAREVLPELRRLGVELIEQPFPAEDLDAYHRYRELRGRLPIFIDEGCRNLASVPHVATYADGVVVKLAKCGGIREATRLLHAAQALGLGVMMGCMVESQLGIAQAAQLAPMANLVDLDGHLLLADQPFSGLGLQDGHLRLPDAPGLGVTSTTAPS